MNLPNKLTLFRVILIPFFLFFLLTGYGGAYSKWIALGIFAVASLTDLLDGKIARKYHLVTNFGKFMDPLADKLLVCSAMIAFIELGRMPSWVVIIIISREFAISGFRLVAADNDVVIAASWWGKIKTVSQMVMVILMIADIEQLALVTEVIMWLALVLTLVSMIDYFIKNRGVMKGSM
ncbi:MAG: CDP-diacylglycerol--glycerol-3-phosphate 3-phosphatidyltransferase [Lachnospiraceae bacterium]|nr:CDP-diacylglycerol--glycerol-3-phosphate 3-phosphatidyltransferase [Lachnospiraceae bacterium]